MASQPFYRQKGRKNLSDSALQQAKDQKKEGNGRKQTKRRK
jgi:hypothetical protein